MSDDRNNFFDAVFNNSDDSFSRVGFENRTVRRLFKECGVVIPSMGRLVNICRAETGEPYFRFDWFNDRYSDFPARLAGRRIGYCGTRESASGGREKVNLYQLGFADLMRPKNNLFLRALKKALVAEDISPYFDQSFVFVFPVRRRMFCAHTLGSNLSPGPGSELTAQATLKFSFNERILCVQPTESVFAAIGPDWFSD